MKDNKILQSVLNRIILMDTKIDKVDGKVEKGFKEVNKRIDRRGRDLAYLEEDAPTREEHDNLEKRVTKIEVRLAKTI